MRLFILIALFFALSFPVPAQRTKINPSRDIDGPVPISVGGTGQTTAQAAIDALVPNQTNAALKFLQSDGTNVSWHAAIPSYTIASPPAAPYTGLVVVFTDAASSSDCSTGGGFAKSLCRYNGSSYDAIGGSAASGLADPGANGIVVRTSSGTTTPRTITAGIGAIVTNGDGVSDNPTVAADTAVMLTRAQAQAGSDLRCVPASASGANYTCSMSPTLGSYTDGMVIQFEPDVDSIAGAVTLNIDSLGSANIKQSDGITDPGAAALVAGRQVPLTYDGLVWRMGATSSGGGGGATAFTDLTDTPSTYTSSSGHLLRVNSTQNAVEFLAPPAGDLVGTTATQTLTNKTIDCANNTCTNFPGNSEELTLVSVADLIGTSTNNTGWAGGSYTFAPSELQVGDMVYIYAMLEAVDGGDTTARAWSPRLRWNGTTDFGLPANSYSVNQIMEWTLFVASSDKILLRFKWSNFNSYNNETVSINMIAGGTLEINLSAQSGDDTIIAPRLVIRRLRYQ